MHSIEHISQENVVASLRATDPALCRQEIAPFIEVWKDLVGTLAVVTLPYDIEDPSAQTLVVLAQAKAYAEHVERLEPRIVEAKIPGRPHLGSIRRVRVRIATTIPEAIYIAGACPSHFGAFVDGCENCVLAHEWQTIVRQERGARALFEHLGIGDWDIQGLETRVRYRRAYQAAVEAGARTRKEVPANA